MGFVFNNLSVELWPFRPDWASPYRVSVEFKTEVITSRSGKQQRRALRIRPRKTVEFTSTVRGSAYIDLKRLLTRWQNGRFVLPEITRSVSVTSDIATGTSVIPVSSVPFWAAVGRDLVIQTPLTPYKWQQSVHKIQSINSGANTITITNGTEFAWAAGTSVHPALLCLMDPQTAVTSKTSTFAEINVKFAVDPGYEPEMENPASYLSFEGREVLTAQPNWSSNPSTDFIYPYEQIDFGRGVIETIRPIQFSTTSRRMSYLAQTPAEAETLLAQFMRAKGQRGEFWLESGEPDIIPSVATPANNNIITLYGKDVFDTYADDTVHKALYFKMKDGVEHRTRITSVTLVGGNTLITLDTPLNQIVSADTIVRIAWLRVSRHATDVMTIDWLTQSVAQTQMTVQSLEYAVAEN